MLRSLGLLLIACFFLGCSVSEEDRNFYYSGWLNPNRRSGINTSQRHVPDTAYKLDPLVDH